MFSQKKKAPAALQLPKKTYIDLQQIQERVFSEKKAPAALQLPKKAFKRAISFPYTHLYSLK